MAWEKPRGLYAALAFERSVNRKRCESLKRSLDVSSGEASVVSGSVSLK